MPYELLIPVGLPGVALVHLGFVCGKCCRDERYDRRLALGRLRHREVPAG
jgi:hypothetical protein